MKKKFFLVLVAIVINSLAFAQSEPAAETSSAGGSSALRSFLTNEMLENLIQMLQSYPTTGTVEISPEVISKIGAIMPAAPAKKTDPQIYICNTPARSKEVCLNLRIDENRQFNPGAFIDDMLKDSLVLNSAECARKFSEAKALIAKIESDVQTQNSLNARLADQGLDQKSLKDSVNFTVKLHRPIQDLNDNKQRAIKQCDVTIEANFLESSMSKYDFQLGLKSLASQDAVGISRQVLGADTTERKGSGFPGFSRDTGQGMLPALGTH